ncbi:MAG: hypothetical protein ACT4QF_12265 [Sporichthyaceae bacterium]
MGHQLVIWEGERPLDLEAGIEEMRAMGRLYLMDEPVEPTPAIRRFVEALTAIWPDDFDDPGFEVSPWKSCPVLQSASGPTIYLNLTLGGGWRESNRIASIGADYGLVTFDCVLGMLLPAPQSAVDECKLEMWRETAEAIERVYAAPRPSTAGAWRHRTRRRRWG